MFRQLTSVPQAPELLHVCVALTFGAGSQRCSPAGSHSTQRCVAPLQKGVAPAQAVVFGVAIQRPVPSHVCGVRLSIPPQRVVPGMHEPVHVPPLQTNGHGLALSTNVPNGPHVCGVRLFVPPHCCWPGAQLPVQLPLMHV
jgi:hypothetical protein